MCFNGNACLVFMCKVFYKAHGANNFPQGAIKLFAHEKMQTWNEVENMSCYTKSKYVLKTNIHIKTLHFWLHLNVINSYNL